MCGIVGFWENAGRRTRGEMWQIAENMATAIRHRGPDHGDCWVEEKFQIGFGHRRLSIVDLSPEGHQPMVSSSGRFIIVLNGEIYNFLDLREELLGAGYSFRGHSDTEIALAAFEEWGIATALEKFVGMFAIAVWDREKATLSLARDRIGEKPLYYGFLKDGTLVFASELKALSVHPSWSGQIDREALTLLLRYNYVPAPYSIFVGIQKLTPGVMTVISRRNGSWQETRTEFWSAQKVVRAGFEHPGTANETEATESLEHLLRQAIKQQMIADVPLGAFLSGGVDSSTVVALMQAQSARPVKTFTIGFWEKEYNEAEHAKAVAQHLGTDHTELYVTPPQAEAVIPLLPGLYDEPFADSSQIPTFLVAQLARQHVTVSLSGDAGDELFGGYNRYFLGQKVWNGLSWIPTRLREAIGQGMENLSLRKLTHLLAIVEPFLPKNYRQRLYADKLMKFCEVLQVRQPLEIYQMLVSQWKHPERVVIQGREPPHFLTSELGSPLLPDFVQMMMYLDLLTYLPDDILVKVDRACMGVSLESRVPFLDHRVVEFAWQLPLHLKIKNGQGKWLLRQVLYKHVPKELIERPKMGFGVPIDQWLRSSLRPWAEDLLSEDRLRREGFFDPVPIREKWQEHVAGKRNWQYYLWSILMFQAWLEKNHPRSSV
jgi:asparagine synthase (glutamine-hydrolysing)